MVHQLIAFALRQRFVVLVTATVAVLAGIWAFRALPIDAYPDLSPPQVEIITQWPGHAAEEVERLVTIPLEIAFNGAPGITVERSISLYGLSDVRLVFGYDTNPYFDRDQIFQRIADAALPAGVTPTMAPLFSPSGLIYRYVLESPDRSPQELKVIQDWVLFRRYKAIPGIADDSGLGGTTRQYQVVLDANALNTYHVAVADVVTALSNNNQNAGGGFYQLGGQFTYVRGLGRITDLPDIGNVVIANHNGVPIHVANVGKVTLGDAPRLGQFGYMKQDEAVEGVLFLRTGDPAQTVLESVEAVTDKLNRDVLPKDVRVHPYYDRTDLVHLTTRTVEHNMLLGVLLVTVILVLFLRSFRTGLIVATTIPLALAVAFLLLKIRHVPANLLSLGAVDFGILVDAGVIMVENIFRVLGERRIAAAGTLGNAAAREPDALSVDAAVLGAAKDVGRPIFYSTAVIIAAYLPIYVLSGPAARLFSPMADTVVFALLGTLIFSLTLLPVLCSIVMRKGVQDREGPVFGAFKRWYMRMLERCLARPLLTTLACVLAFAVTLLTLFSIGSEFMPKLDEGALWVRATMPYTISFDEAEKIPPQIRKLLLEFPQVTTVADELGRPDDGTDPTGFFNCEFYVGLEPYDSWTGPIETKAELVHAIKDKLARFPGIIFNYTQPAEDAVDEASTGLKSALAIKVFGPDLKTLESVAGDIKKSISRVEGINEITIVRELGQPNLDVKIDRQKVARYGLDVATIDGMIEAAVGGVTATQVIQGERQFDLVVRMDERYRADPDAIGRLLVTTPSGQRLPLSTFAALSIGQGPAFVYRETGERYIGIQYSIEGRDLGSAVNDAIAAVARDVHVPTGYTLQWGGEYRDFLDAKAEMRIIIPLTVLLIFFIIFGLYGNLKYPLMIAVSVLVTEVQGGLIALWLGHTNLSVSSGLGFLALFGVSVQTGIIFISHANKLRKAGLSLDEATRESAAVRLRPILITALVACVGLMPAAFSHAIGSDSQRPFAQVVVGGLLSRLALSIFLLPVLYRWASRSGDRLEV
ncbi:MAG TPA: CusA/CzcA family heavy metal efflux RND transporter [Kofleriaceae bacterium]|jgi:cobalt-zinc-cadmium resistance protein CzcA|nr:CusA/CzcA family heavy metal efflux RND transporter [Kofleriaceae bacterium]